MSKTRSVVAAQAPHSWGLESWPQTVYPHTPGRARYVVRAHRDELIMAGALTRIGRDLVVLGAAYSRWLESQSGRVDGFVIAPNRQAADQAAA